MTQHDDPRSGDDFAAEASGPVPPQPEPAPELQSQPELQPQPEAQPPSPSLRGPVLAFVAVAAVVMLAGVAAIGFAIYEVVQPDSGIAACEAIRDSESNQSDRDSKMTEEEYREVREQFADSAHADIREHGTKLMDVLWQVDQLPEGQEMAALALIGPLAEHATGLQSACADQGVHISVGPN
jgi:hypothetical protein